jgi:2,4-dienoyl-CoA reductase-like NADH-dependent reductase (Old Yellow Enzyme family)
MRSHRAGCIVRECASLQRKRWTCDNAAVPHLFDPLPLRSLTLPNRVVVSPMCQYSCVDGFATDWHLVHLGSRSVGGAGLVFTEATAVTADGRISPYDLGIWTDAHIDSLARIARFVRAQGSVAGIQLAHAGRKASTTPPWQGIKGIGTNDGGWTPVGPTAVAFSPTAAAPRSLALDEIPTVIEAFQTAAARAQAAGFQVVELHAAHGYLIQEFLSPLVNTRTDAYGGTFDRRIRLCREVAAAIRSVWPDELPVFVRISSTDWKDGGWDIEQSVALGKELRNIGVDLIDCSGGGAVPDVTIPVAPGYQVPFAARVRREAGIATGAVGLITEPDQADTIIRSDQADCVFLARELLRDPYWPMHAAQKLGHPSPWPVQYLRAAAAGTPARPRDVKL